MTYQEKLKVAKCCYRAVKSAIEWSETAFGVEVFCHWDECITVDDELFHGHQLRENG